MGEMKVRRSLRQIEPIALELQKLLRPACHRIEVAGSIRRRRFEVADIELVAIPKVEIVETRELLGARLDAVNLLWSALEGLGDRIERLKWGDKYRAFLWPIDGVENVQVDLFTADTLNWGLIYLIRTGSASYSRHIVTELRRYGYIADQGRVYRHAGNGKPAGEPIPVPEEEDVFKLVKKGVVKPLNRSWR